MTVQNSKKGKKVSKASLAKLKGVNIGGKAGGKDVEGQAALYRVICPYCGAVNVVRSDWQWFICWSCNQVVMNPFSGA